MDISQIVSVQLQESGGYLLNGTMSVPLAEGNNHYNLIQEWIRLGNTPLPVPKDPLINIYNSRLTYLNNSSSSAIQDITSKYPDFERLSWVDQESEAKAWITWNVGGQVGTEPTTPTLTPICTIRGITLEDLCSRVVTKASSYRAAVAEVIGKRQLLEDQLTDAYDDAVVAESSGDEVTEDAKRAEMLSISWI